MGSFAERLKELIGEQSVAAFARQCNIPVTSIRSNLQGIEPGRGNLAAIAKHTGVSMAWLVAGEGSKYGAFPILGDLQGRGDLLMKSIEGMNSEAEKKALLDEFQSRVEKEKQFSDLKKKLGKGGRKKKAC